MEFLRGFRCWVVMGFLFWGFCFSPQIIAQEESKTSPPQINFTSNQSSLLPPPPSSSSPPLLNNQNATSFRPSIAVIVAVLTTMFSITFLLLLYAKHCKGSNGYQGNLNSTVQSSSTARRNSGIDRSVIESLPVFRFASLRGQKEGLECSVCLNRFESNEVLRLLPKCKHAFHVECVDTWLDAHSTCPLCRYRVDPEDVLLIEVDKDFQRRSVEEQERRRSEAFTELDNRKSDEFTRRISGRHSSAGERISNFLQILVQRPGESTQKNDSVPSCRRSVDSAISRKINETVTVGCFDRGVRKDGLLLSETAEVVAEDRENFLRRFDHQIILSTESGSHKRWSELRPSDLLFLQSEMIISNSGRYSLSSHRQKTRVAEHQRKQQMDEENGRNVINTRCVSEITGLSRYANKTEKVVGPKYHRDQH
ncbi:hypothetical protein AQUCO_06900013v1 [Aquilegia coerulea]|uniref:RING-type E3 ubiquitin transferase n=1 Tax=Aquilegia coerulea TaxID=218851 RepID=A0A2G5CAY9_AQUCA|nr:hypothetical protein AQUCO_06900013v1 [Aquilegia coerulea]